MISVRGTSGSGKSTIVRKLMGKYPEVTPIYAQPRVLAKELPKHLMRANEKTRKNPIAYLCQKPNPRGFTASLAVLGSYATPCGGCDTISSYERIFELVRAFDQKGHHVLFEGLLISGAVNQFVDLWNEKQNGISIGGMLVIALKVSLETCLAGVTLRREQRGEEKALNPANTEAKWKCIQSAMKRLEEAGVPNVWLTRQQTLKRLEKEFGL